MSAKNISFEINTVVRLVQTNLYRIGGPILFILGTISCLLSYAILKKKNIRNNTCTIYFFSFNLSNLLLIYTSLTISMLSAGYNISPSAYNPTFCRFQIFTFTLFDCLSGFYLILASMDRMFITSLKINTRRRSNNTLALKCIISGTIFLVIFSFHSFIFAQIIELMPNNFACFVKPGIYVIFLSQYSLIKGIAMPSLLILFGSIALKNIRASRRISGALAVTTEGNHVYTPSAKDRKFILVIFLNTIAHIIFGLPMSIFLVYTQITQYEKKSDRQKLLELYIRTLVSFSLYFRACLCGYINLIISKSMRQQIINVVLRKKVFPQR